MDGRRSGDADDSRTDLTDAAPDVVETAPIRRGMVLGGRYAVEKIIGRGGSGVVVRAHDRDLNQVVAIKIVRAELSGQRVWAGRLAREVRLARQIHHPHVCRVFDFEQGDGRAFLVMELAENGTLRDELRAGQLKASPVADRVVDARAVASALAAIHAAGIVHRDLSPQNVLRMADGRLVLSDFGLATDASESTSVHGGTIAYMAPEVMRGDRSTVASDIWSLGVLMYEIVFGDKPRWSEGAAPEILTPALGRKLTDDERAVLETCRACTVKEPSKRIPAAADAARMLSERRRWRLPRVGLSRRSVKAAVALSVVLGAMAAGVAWRRRETSRMRSPATPDAPLVTPTGAPADWTNVSTVLAEVPERISCMVGLADKRTVRIVWGTPPRAEDIDTQSHRRFPSPLVPAAYAEGCPDLSPDGRRVVYQGHVEDGRAFAFVSEHADGSDARPVVATAEPSHLSEPKWLADGATFSYDVDTRQIGIYSLETNRSVIVPANEGAHFSSSRWSNGNQVFLEKLFQDRQSEIVGHLWPSLAEFTRFRLSGFSADFRSSDGSNYYYARVDDAETGGVEGAVVALTLTSKSARRIGAVPGQFIRHLVLVDGGLAFVSMRATAEVEMSSAAGGRRSVTTGTYVSGAAICGDSLLTADGSGNRIVINRRTFKGTLVAGLTEGPMDTSPSCSATGQRWCYVRYRPGGGVACCEDRRCTQITDKDVLAARISPDGSRIVFTAAEKRGLAIYVGRHDGSGVRELTVTETLCSPGWSSSHTVWVSRRHGRDSVWREIDVDSGHDTGKTIAGTTDCMNGDEDPASPVERDVRVVARRTAQVRVVPSRSLRVPE